MEVAAQTIPSFIDATQERGIALISMPTWLGKVWQGYIPDFKFLFPSSEWTVCISIAIVEYEFIASAPVGKETEWIRNKMLDVE